MKLGATVQSWSGSSPRHVLENLVNEKPGASKEELFAAFRETITRDEYASAVDSILEYWFYNNYRYLVERPRTTAQDAPARAASRASVEGVKSSIKAAAVKMVLLDMMLPHGKKLADSTGQECRDLGPKVGAWLTAIAGQIMPNEVVGKTMSEQRVRELFEAA